MFADYKLLVLEDYRIKKATDSLALNLCHASPAKLKAESLAVFDTRFLKKDEKLLVSFFGLRENEFEYRQAIKQCEADRFKPLSNYLKQSTRDTDEKNIELLAWLINFEPRPYQVNKAHVLKGNTNPADLASYPSDVDKGRIETDKAKARKIRLTWAVPVVLILMTYLTWHYASAVILPPRFPTTGQEQCMYWADDHYQPISCNQKIENTPIYALDSMKLAHLKLITNTDTIGKKAIGHVWYAKINGKVEFYTSDGFHPIYTARRLRPLSLYIYTKYLLNH
jgi:hypothetical protein